MPLRLVNSGLPLRRLGTEYDYGAVRAQRTGGPASFRKSQSQACKVRSYGTTVSTVSTVSLARKGLADTVHQHEHST
jgi:hypothetical protein